MIREVAAAVDSAPERLTPPLYEAVDPEALDRLFRGRGEGSVECVVFTWAGCRVVVDDAGEVDVSRFGDPTDPSGGVVRPPSNG